MNECPCGVEYRLAVPWNGFDPTMVDEDEWTCRHGDYIIIHPADVSPLQV